MRELFQGYNVQAVSKLISPHRDRRPLDRTTTVDLATAHEAKKAVRALNGRENPYGDQYNVTLFTRIGNNPTIVEREQLGTTSRILVGHLPEYPDQAALENDMKQLLCIFQIVYISEVHAPSTEKAKEGGNRHFCFFELQTPQDAHVAVYRFDNLPTPWGGTYKLRIARGPDHDVPPRLRADQKSRSSEQRKSQRDLNGSWRRTAKVLSDSY